MNLRQSVFGEVAVTSGQHVTCVDIGSLIRRLLLFDRVVIKSIRLREIPVLVRAFQKAGFTQLLNSGLLSFSCEFTSLIVDVSRGGVRDIPPNHFSFGIVDAAHRESDLRAQFVALQSVPGLSNSDRAALEEVVWNSLVRPHETYGRDLLSQFDNDIRTNNPALKCAILERLGAELAPYGLPVSDVSVRVQEVKHRVFHIDAPFASYGFSADKSHGLLQAALLAVANLDTRLANMQAYSAITGFLDREAPLLFGRLAGVMAPLNPDVAEGQFQRVIELADIPDFKPGQKVDVERLLRARDSAECREFREWLSSAEDMSDSQIKEMVASVRSKIASLAGSTTGKVLRLATTTGVGFIPIVGPIAGAAAGAIDSFLVDRVLPKSGVVAFLSETYPSLFVSS
jgi:hypothetical protein